jgi:predicted nucleic acid-binding protein
MLMDETDVIAYLEEFSNVIVVETRLSWSFKALEIKKRYDLQFYDSLIIAAAEASGCDKILTEDLADGQVCCGVKAENPFK